MRNEWLEGGEFEMMVLSKVRQDPGPAVCGGPWPRGLP